MTHLSGTKSSLAARLACIVVLWILGAGCGGGGKAARGGRDTVADLHLFGVPVALNLDGVPGPDGIGVRIYASGPGIARGVAIRQGTLEVVLFEGVVDAGAIGTTQPLKVWSFDAPALKPLVAETSLGLGYQLALRWGAERPTDTVVTVVARYRSPAGAVIYSTSNTISVQMK